MLEIAEREPMGGNVAGACSSVANVFCVGCGTLRVRLSLEALCCMHHTLSRPTSTFLPGKFSKEGDPYGGVIAWRATGGGVEDYGVRLARFPAAVLPARSGE